MKKKNFILKAALLSIGIIGIIIALIVCGIMFVYGITYFFAAEPTVLETYVSPDKEYTAYVFESNGGATTGWIYHVSVLKTGKELRKGSGNIYISSSPPESITWLDDTTLYIYDYRDLHTTKRREKIYDITVIFNSLGLEE